MLEGKAGAGSCAQLQRTTGLLASGAPWLMCLLARALPDVTPGEFIGSLLRLERCRAHKLAVLLF